MAHAYMMKLILHDWNDEECIQILRKDQRDAATSGARVFIIEHVIPDPDTPHFANRFDIADMKCAGTDVDQPGGVWRPSGEGWLEVCYDVGSVLACYRYHRRREGLMQSRTLLRVASRSRKHAVRDRPR